MSTKPEQIKTLMDFPEYQAADAKVREVERQLAATETALCALQDVERTKAMDTADVEQYLKTGVLEANRMSMLDCLKRRTLLQRALFIACQHKLAVEAEKTNQIIEQMLPAWMALQRDVLDKIIELNNADYRAQSFIKTAQAIGVGNAAFGLPRVVPSAVGVQVADIIRRAERDGITPTPGLKPIIEYPKYL